MVVALERAEGGRVALQGPSLHRVCGCFPSRQPGQLAQSWFLGRHRMSRQRERMACRKMRRKDRMGGGGCGCGCGVGRKEKSGYRVSNIGCRYAVVGR